MDDNLFKAILAMDSYNRGYGEGIKNLGGLNTKIGTATITNQSNTDLDSNEFKSGFYAISYKLTSGETVISYRGTDNFDPADIIIDDTVMGGNDVVNGYGPGLGIPGGPQTSQAIDFYKAVAGTSGTALKTANISITGHSLGAGLG